MSDYIPAILPLSALQRFYRNANPIERTKIAASCINAKVYCKPTKRASTLPPAPMSTWIPVEDNAHIYSSTQAPHPAYGPKEIFLGLQSSSDKFLENNLSLCYGLQLSCAHVGTSLSLFDLPFECAITSTSQRMELLHGWQAPLPANYLARIEETLAPWHVSNGAPLTPNFWRIFAGQSPYDHTPSCSDSSQYLRIEIPQADSTVLSVTLAHTDHTLARVLLRKAIAQAVLSLSAMPAIVQLPAPHKPLSATASQYWIDPSQLLFQTSETTRVPFSTLLQHLEDTTPYVPSGDSYYNKGFPEPLLPPGHTVYSLALLANEHLRTIALEQLSC